MADPLKIDALKGTKLAAELDPAQIAVLADLIELRDLKQGDVLVREGTSDNHLFVVLKGVIGVVKNVGTPDAVTFNTFAAGDLVSELSSLDGSQRYASVVALGDVRVVELERERLESLIDSHPRIVYCVMRAIIRFVHQAQRRLSMQQVELSNYIYKQHGRY
ncbi:MAG: cyclic nucleotide-binding domain-containing protein [Betaproteobacteria bacterium]